MKCPDRRGLLPLLASLLLFGASFPALADLLLVDGDHVDNIKLLENPERKLLVIMKDGKVYKNLVGPASR